MQLISENIKKPMIKIILGDVFSVGILLNGFLQDIDWAKAAGIAGVIIASCNHAHQMWVRMKKKKEDKKNNSEE